MADDALNAHEAGGSLLAPRSGGTLICCPVCAAAVQRGFSKVFYGRRIDPRTGREVPLTHELLPNDAASLSEEDILDNSTSLRSYLAHFLLEHPDIEYEPNYAGFSWRGPGAKQTGAFGPQEGLAAAALNPAPDPNPPSPKHPTQPAPPDTRPEPVQLQPAVQLPEPAQLLDPEQVLEAAQVDPETLQQEPRKQSGKKRGRPRKSEAAQAAHDLVDSSLTLQQDPIAPQALPSPQADQTGALVQPKQAAGAPSGTAEQLRDPAPRRLSAGAASGTAEQPHPHPHPQPQPQPAQPQRRQTRHSGAKASPGLRFGKQAPRKVSGRGSGKGSGKGSGRRASQPEDAESSMVREREVIVMIDTSSDDEPVIEEPGKAGPPAVGLTAVLGTQIVMAGPPAAVGTQVAVAGPTAALGASPLVAGPADTRTGPSSTPQLTEAGRADAPSGEDRADAIHEAPPSLMHDPPPVEAPTNGAGTSCEAEETAIPGADSPTLPLHMTPVADTHSAPGATPVRDTTAMTHTLAPGAMPVPGTSAKNPTSAPDIMPVPDTTVIPSTAALDTVAHIDANPAPDTTAHTDIAAQRRDGVPQALPEAEPVTGTHSADGQPALTQQATALLARLQAQAAPARRPQLQERLQQLQAAAQQPQVQPQPQPQPEPLPTVPARKHSGQQASPYMDAPQTKAVMGVFGHPYDTFPLAAPNDEAPAVPCKALWDAVAKTHAHLTAAAGVVGAVAEAGPGAVHVAYPAEVLVSLAAKGTGSEPADAAAVPQALDSADAEAHELVNPAGAEPGAEPAVAKELPQLAAAAAAPVPGTAAPPAAGESDVAVAAAAAAAVAQKVSPQGAQTGPEPEPQGLHAMADTDAAARALAPAGTGAASVQASPQVSPRKTQPQPAAATAANPATAAAIEPEDGEGQVKPPASQPQTQPVSSPVSDKAAAKDVAATQTQSPVTSPGRNRPRVLGPVLLPTRLPDGLSADRDGQASELLQKAERPVPRQQQAAQQLYVPPALRPQPITDKPPSPTHQPASKPGAAAAAPVAPPRGYGAGCKARAVSAAADADRAASQPEPAAKRSRVSGSEADKGGVTQSDDGTGGLRAGVYMVDALDRADAQLRKLDLHPDHPVLGSASRGQKAECLSGLLSWLGLLGDLNMRSARSVWLWDTDEWEPTWMSERMLRKVSFDNADIQAMKLGGAEGQLIGREWRALRRAWRAAEARYASVLAELQQGRRVPDMNECYEIQNLRYLVKSYNVYVTTVTEESTPEEGELSFDTRADAAAAAAAAVRAATTRSDTHSVKGADAPTGGGAQKPGADTQSAAAVQGGVGSVKGPWDRLWEDRVWEIATQIAEDMYDRQQAKRRKRSGGCTNGAAGR